MQSSFYEIGLFPEGFLIYRCIEAVDAVSEFASLQDRFERQWQEGWFYLAADKLFVDPHPSLRYWQGIAREYLTKLCHVPEETEFSSLEMPRLECLNEWLIQAPPMIGGEYLSIARLQKLWDQLNHWAEQAARNSGSLSAFLQEYAPKWRQVGRVCFHLAENKRDSQRPFAFLATYSTGFGATGKVQHLPLKNALEQSCEAGDRQFLVKLLTPVQKAAERCPWVQDLVNTAALYQPLAWSSHQAYQFLTSIPLLEESGLSVRIPNWWKQRPRPQVAVTIGSKTRSTLGLDSMLDFQVEVSLGGEPLSAEELQRISSAATGLISIRGQWIEIDKEKLHQALEHWKTVQKKASNGQISFVEGMRLLAGAPSSLQSEEVVEQQRSWVEVSSGKALTHLLQQLRDPSQIPSAGALEPLQATLRPYQQEGVHWLSLLSGLGLGACLADDMGLGKTLQVLVLLLLQKQRRKKDSLQVSLLVVPASLLGNWKREAEKFTPSLKLFFLHPSEGTAQLCSEAPTQTPGESLQGVDLVVTTYAMVLRQKWLAQVDWNLLILDEAQAIKNAGTKQSKAVKALKARARIALTGTPIENHLSDLWSLFDFLNPGLLGSSSRFREYMGALQTGARQFEPLRKLVSPYILRRMKTDPRIIPDLPEKIETPTYCLLTQTQVQYYQATVEGLKRSLREVTSLQRRGVVLQTLLRLKQICNHPVHFSGVGEYLPSQSGKFLRLGQLCEELASRQERMLVFTQFKEIIDPLAKHLRGIFGREGLTLHGDTPIRERQKLVETFQSDQGPPFFVLSLKAGGTGLTLTAASHVVHFDRWWNPAVENQATDRAFRIGQKKNVQVHTLITQGTVEEQIDKMISAKKDLAFQVLHNTEEIKLTEMPDEELIALVSLDLDRAHHRDEKF